MGAWHARIAASATHGQWLHPCLQANVLLRLAQEVLDARDALVAAQAQIDALTRQVATAGQLQQHMAQQDELLAKLQEDLAASEFGGQVRLHCTEHDHVCPLQTHT